MRIHDLILPHDRVFLSLFSEMAVTIGEAATVLNEITHQLPQGMEKAHRVRQIEHNGDEITRKIYEKLIASPHPTEKDREMMKSILKLYDREAKKQSKDQSAEPKKQ